MQQLLNTLQGIAASCLTGEGDRKHAGCPKHLHLQSLPVLSWLHRHARHLTTTAHICVYCLSCSSAEPIRDPVPPYGLHLPAAFKVHRLLLHSCLHCRTCALASSEFSAVPDNKQLPYQHTR